MNRSSHRRLVCGSLVLATCLHAGVQTFAQTAPVAPASPSAPNGGTGGTVFDDLIMATLRDFGRFPSRETLAWVGGGAAIAALGHTADDTATTSMSGSRALESVFASGETLGATHVQFAGAAATYAVGRFTGSRRVAQIGAELIRAQIVTQGVTAAIKMSVQRSRPDGTQYSFPSGHSSAMFASATVLQRNFGWKVGIPAYSLAAYVAASRVQEKRHFLSDVAFGAAIGIAAGRTVTIGHGGREFALAPVAVPGGGAVQFTWIGQQ